MPDVTPEQFARLLRRRSSGTILKTLNRFAIRKAARAEKYAKKNAGRVLNVRSGRLRASINAKPVAMGDNTIAILLRAGGRDKGVSYARAHEEGKIIKPVNVNWLTIPIHESLVTPSGVAKYASARDVPETLFWDQTKKGQPVLRAEETGEVFYLLKKQVKIRKRPYMKPAVEKVRREIGRDLKPLIRTAVTNG